MKKALNILLGVILAITVVLLVYALVSPHPVNPADYDPSVSLNIIWVYFLVMMAIASAIFSAVFGMIQNPQGIKSSLLSLLLMVVVIGAAYLYSAGHTVNIPNMQSVGSFFEQGPTVLTETSIIVTYVAFVAAVLTSIGTEIYRAFK